MKLVDDSEEFKRKIKARYTLKEMMEHTSLSRSWIQRCFEENGIIASGKRGRSKVYDGFAVDKLLESKPRPKTAKKSETPETSKTSKNSMEYEERISYLEQKIKEVEMALIRTIKKFNESQKSETSKMS